MLVVFELACLQTDVRIEVRFIAPTGDRFVGLSGSTTAGCNKGGVAPLPLDALVGSRSARTITGTWRAEVYLDGTLQGSVTFEVD